MMDASSLFPAGHHPIVLSRLPDLSQSAYPLPRRTTSVRYYLTDFGLSTAFSRDDEARLVLGRWGLDKGVPELSDTVPYDPFKTDIWILGNFIRTTLLQVCRTHKSNLCMTVLTGAEIRQCRLPRAHGDANGPNRPCVEAVSRRSPPGIQESPSECFMDEPILAT